MFDTLRIGLLGLALLALAPALQAAEPIHVAVSTEVDIAPDRAWQNLQDFSLAHNYVPGITRTEITTRERQGIGASRRVYKEDGDYLEETIVAWDEGQGFAIRLHKGDKPMAPFKSAEFRYHMEPVDADTTRMTVAILTLMPWGGLGEWLGNWVARPTMEDELVQVAAGLKHYYETGTPATDADRERLAGAVNIVPDS